MKKYFLLLCSLFILVTVDSCEALKQSNTRIEENSISAKVVVPSDISEELFDFSSSTSFPDQTSVQTDITQTEPVITENNHSFEVVWAADEFLHWHTGSYGEKYQIAAHSFGQWNVDQEATCAASGSRHRVCSMCGKRVSEEIPQVIAHSYYPWIVDKEATCTESGNRHHVCSVCGKRENEINPARGHTVVIDKAVAVTCSVDGLTEGSHCSVCDATIVASVNIPAKGHVKERVPARSATCTEAGATEGWKCAVCGDAIISSVSIPAKGHMKERVPARSATCTEAGTTEGWQCTVCGETTSDIVPALGHHGDWDVIQEATCTADGVESRECSMCHKTDTRVLASPGHKYQKTVFQPTCVKNGYDHYECTRCHEKYDKDWPELNCVVSMERIGVILSLDGYFEKYKINVTITGGCSEGQSTDAVIIISNLFSYSHEDFMRQMVEYNGSFQYNDIVELNGKYSNEIYVNIDTADGIGYQCLYFVDDCCYRNCKLKQPNHSYNDRVIAPTQFEDGYTVHTCLVCGYEYKDNTTPALGDSD